MLNKGTKFFVTWTPEYINGEENFHSQTVSRKGTWDEKSKIGINKKTGKKYMTFWVMTINILYCFCYFTQDL